MIIETKTTSDGYCEMLEVDGEKVFVIEIDGWTRRVDKNNCIDIGALMKRAYEAGLRKEPLTLEHIVIGDYEELLQSKSGKETE